ncbi:AraC family transcriptional regulator [Aeoliella mucimassa]|nr:DNA-binding transcriptional regulator [Aeoliella mucimassa]
MMTLPNAANDSFSTSRHGVKPIRIALLIDTSTTWGAGLIEGIVDYAKAKHKQWLFSFEHRGKNDRLMLPESWVGNGVIARINHPDLAEQIIARKIPAVNVSWFRFGENLIPTCTCDEEKVAEMAIRYLLGKGHRQFAYCASVTRPGYYDRLGKSFVDQLQQNGFACAQFNGDFEQLARLDTEHYLMELGKWLKQLPRPTALLAFDDLLGRLVTEACAQSGIVVPDDIAVLGGEHDELCSRVSSPPLSGVDQSAHEVGFHAAEMLDRQLSGYAGEIRNIRLSPARIISRQSTDKVAVEDEMLAEAIRYIEEHYAGEITIRDILKEIPLSRRALEIGFRRYLGRTPRDEIRRVRVQKALEFLCDTEWSVTKIANECGFDRPELLTRAFRREFKATPSEFRKRFANRKPPITPDARG